MGGANARNVHQRLRADSGARVGCGDEDVRIDHVSLMGFKRKVRSVEHEGMDRLARRGKCCAVDETDRKRTGHDAKADHDRRTWMMPIQSVAVNTVSPS